MVTRGAPKRKATKKKTKTAAKKGGKKKSSIEKGSRYVCETCGLVVRVDEVCGCVDVCDIICCGEQMSPTK